MSKKIKMLIIFISIFVGIVAEPEMLEFDFGDVALREIDIKRKDHGVREMKGKVENLSSKVISKVRLGIKFKDSKGTSEEYVTIGTPTYYNIQPGEIRKIKTYLIVEEIDGRDVKIEVEEIISEEIEKG